MTKHEGQCHRKIGGEKNKFYTENVYMIHKAAPNSIPRYIDNFYYKIVLLLLILRKINIMIINNILNLTCKGYRINHYQNYF